jgi:hypothetical protein
MSKKQETIVCYIAVATVALVSMLVFNHTWDRLSVKLVVALGFSILMGFGMLVRSQEHGLSEPKTPADPANDHRGNTQEEE